MANHYSSYRAYGRNNGPRKPHTVPVLMPFTKFIVSPTRNPAMRRAGRLRKGRPCPITHG
jgi:hypothetical protein